MGPDAKRLKPTPPDPAVVRKQVEYYLSDENLRYDKFFHEKITADSEGWLETSLVLSCNKMKALRATKEDVINALKGSKLELREGGTAVRRPANLALPKLEARPPQHQKKSSLHAHGGGCLVVVKDVPAEQSWVQVKKKLKASLPEKANLWYVSEVNDKAQCFAATAPFDNDVKFYEDIKLEVGGAKLICEICQGDTLQTALKLLPKHIRERREKESRKRQKDRNRPIVVGTQKFLNVGALRGRVKEILNSRSDGEQLKPDGSDFKLIKALLEHHPKGTQKSQGMVGIKVAQSTQGDNRCFFMVKEDGTAEDFSAKKCVDAIELNPPYVKTEPPKEKKNEGEKAQPPASVANATVTKAATATSDEPSKEAQSEAAERKADESKAEDVKPDEKKAGETKAQAELEATTTPDGGATA